MDEEPIRVCNIRRAGSMGAPATARIMPHRETEENEEKLWMMVRTCTDWNPIKEPLGASGLKEGAVVAVGE
jgi:hypothetical protein